MKNLLTVLLMFFSFAAHAQIDTTIGTKAPKKVSKNYKLLAHYICDSLDTDYQKANGIYNWVTHNIAYDVKSIYHSKLRTDKPNVVLKRGKTICGGYSDLVTAMCKEVGIRAQTIIGYYKDWKFDEGDKFFIPNHAWNAVLIDNKWEYIDATAGAGYTSLAPTWFQRLKGKINKKKLYTAKKPTFVQEYDPETFLPNVEDFRIERLSADPLWQLSDTSMPLKVFETGEGSIIAFNEMQSEPQQFSVALSEVNKLDWDEQVMESANRTYDFNTRYTTMLARKKYVDAIYKISDAIAQPNKAKGRAILNTAKKELDETKEIQLDQKKTIAKEATFLKQKNKAKTKSFKEYKQQLDKDNKAKNSLFSTRTKQAKTAIAQVQKKKVALKKKKLPNSVKSITNIKTGSQQKDETDLALKKLEDSVQSRNVQLAMQEATYKKSMETIAYLAEANKNFINEAADYYNETDSLLYTETTARYEMHDDRDREVITPQAKIKELRFGLLNATLDDFVTSYDSLNKEYKATIKLLAAQEQLYKTNFKTLEQYKRQNDDNKELLGFYNQHILEAQEVRENHLAALNDYSESMKAHLDLFAQLKKAHDRELKFTELMSLAENKRNELEAKKIKKDEEWLKAANKKTKQMLTQTKKEASRLFQLRHSSKKKKWQKELKKLEARAKAEE